MKYEYSWCFSVINSAIPSSCQNSSVTKLNITVTKMDVEDSSSAFAPAASDAVVLVHVPEPVQPQQSQTSISSQAATVPSSSALSLSTRSSFDTYTSPTCSNVVKSSPSVLIESPTPNSFISSSASSKRISRAGPKFRVDPLLRVANEPVKLRPFKVVSPRRLSFVEEHWTNLRLGPYFVMHAFLLINILDLFFFFRQWLYPRVLNILIDKLYLRD